MIADEDLFYYTCIAIVVANMTIGWTVLLGTPIYYGRLSSSLSKILINPKIAWFLFEVPNLIWVFYFLLFKHASVSLGLLLFTIHYINRDILYPLSLKTTTKVPLEIILTCILYTSANGYLQCVGFQKGFEPNQALQLIGVALFGIGMWINIKSDRMLQQAKESAGSSDSTGKKKYVVVKGFLFDLISSPNYFGEIIEWFGYYLVCQHSEALLFAVATLDILIPGAIKRHQWNKNNL